MIIRTHVEQLYNYSMTIQVFSESLYY